MEKNNIINRLTKYISNKDAKELEEHIYNFCKEYSEINDTPYLFESIYENKVNEIIDYISKSKYLQEAIKNGKIKVKDIPSMKPDELNPEKYETIIKKKELEEYKKNNIASSDAFTCSKCKKSKCKVSQQQTRAGDEPPTTIVTCLECGHTFRFN